MNEHGIRLRLGALVILALVLLGAMVVMFGSLPGMFQRTNTYVVRFTDAPGLTAGAPVRRSGVKIGRVRDVQLDEETGIVRATVAIDEPYRIRRSEQATLVVGLLGSDASIDFIPRAAVDGDPVERDPVEPGAEMVGFRAATVSTLLRGASEVVPTTQETLNDIRKSIARLEKFVARAEKSIPLAEETLKEWRDLAKSANKTMPDIQKTAVDARELVRAIREAVPDAQKTLEEYRQLALDARRAMPEVLKTNKEVYETVKAARETIPSVERTLDDVRQLAGDTRKLVGEINKLVPVVRTNIEDIGGAARQAQRLLEDADRVIIENRDTFKAALEKLDRNLAQVQKVLSEENIQRVTNTLGNIDLASRDFPRLTRGTEETLTQARATLRQLSDTLRRADASFTDFGKLTGPFSARSERISRNIDEALEKSNATLTDIRSLLKVLDRADGTLRKVLTDPSLYNNLDSAAILLTRMFPRLDRILKDVEVFTDKIARHPELIGVGGAVRGGSGLKGPPTPPIAPPSGVIIPPPYK